jgi:hypothetical protein
VAERDEKARVARGGNARKVRHRNPDFDIRIERVLELRRNDPDDAVGLVVEDQLLVGEIGAAVEPLAPELLVHDHDLRRARLVLAFGQGAAQNRIEVEDFEEIAGYESAPDALGPFTARQVHALRLKGGELFDRARLVAQVVELQDGNAVAVAGGIGREDVDQSFGIMIRQRAQQDGIDDAEDRGVRANAERESENGDDREGRRFQKLTKRIAKIGNHNFGDGTPSCRWIRLFIRCVRQSWG